MNYREVYNKIKNDTENFTIDSGYVNVSSRSELSAAIDILSKVYSDVKNDGLDYSNKDVNGLNYKVKFSNRSLVNESLNKATAYMLKKDGSLIECDLDHGNYHPYVLQVYGDVEDDIKSFVIERSDELKWIYDNTDNEHVKEYIRIIYKSILNTNNDYLEVDDSTYTAEGNELKSFAVSLNNEVNNEFCRVRTSNIKYGGNSNDIYFRISSIGFNWFPVIWKLVMDNKDISSVTISRDNDARDYSQGECYKVNGVEINHMPRDEFLTLKGNPIIERYNFKSNSLNKALRKLTEGYSLTDAIPDVHPRYLNSFYKTIENNQLKNDMNIKLGDTYMKESFRDKDMVHATITLAPGKSADDYLDARKYHISVTQRIGSNNVDLFGERDNIKKYYKEILGIDINDDALAPAKFNDIDEAIEKHDTLNPDLWDENNELHPEVKDKLEEIVDKFQDNLKDNDIDLDITDICIIGSNASYNYNDASDVDLHIIADTSIYDDEDLALKIYLAYKALFNNKYDPTIRGHEVEVYVEPYEVHANSKGIYSLFNGWLKEPENMDIPEIDQAVVDDYLAPFIERYDDVMKSGTVEDVNKLIDDIYLERQKSIMKDGEFAIPNLAFKEFRTNGYLQNLRDRKVELENQAMSLDDNVNSNLESLFIEEEFNTLNESVLPSDLKVGDVFKGNDSVIEILEVNDDSILYRFNDHKHPYEALDPIESFLYMINDFNFKKINEEAEAKGNGFMFRFPEVEDTLHVFLQWEGILGYDSDILDYQDTTREDLASFLEDEGIYGYTYSIWDILKGEKAFCSGMDISDFEDICNESGLDPADAEMFDGETIVEELSNDVKSKIEEAYVVYTDDYFENGKRSYVSDIGDGYTSNGAVDRAEAKVFNSEKEAQDWIDEINIEYDNNPELERFTYGIEKLDESVDGILSIEDIKDEFKKMIDKHPEWTKEKAISFAGDVLRDKGVSYKDLLTAKEEFESNIDEDLDDDNEIFVYSLGGIDLEDRESLNHDIEVLGHYDLHLVGISDNGDYTGQMYIQGSRDDIEQYLGDYIGVVLNSDYLVPEEDFSSTNSYDYLQSHKFNFKEDLVEAKNNKVYKVVKYDSRGRELFFEGTLEELITKFSYTLEKGKSWERERGNHKINMNPKNINSLIDNLNWAVDNAAVNGYSGTFYELVENEDLREGCTRFSRKFDNINDARRFARFLDQDLDPRVEQYDTEKDGEIKNWYEVTWFDPVEWSENDFDMEEAYAVKVMNTENNEEKPIEIDRVDDGDLAERIAKGVDGAWVEKVDEAKYLGSIDDKDQKEQSKKDGVDKDTSSKFDIKADEDKLNEAVDEDDERAIALANYLGVNLDEIDNEYEDHVYTVNNAEEYFVLTKDEAYNQAAKEIENLIYIDSFKDMFSPRFKEYVYNNCINQDEVDDFIESEIEYFRDQEEDENMVTYLEELSDSDRLQYVKDTLGPDTFEDWAEDKLNLDEVAEEAIRQDGVEHFISVYDGEEVELDNNYYAYRIN